MARGPVIVSLWEPVDGPAPGVPYVVFACNVDTDNNLANVVDTLNGPLQTHSPTTGRRPG